MGFVARWGTRDSCLSPHVERLLVRSQTHLVQVWFRARTVASRRPSPLSKAQGCWLTVACRVMFGLGYVRRLRTARSRVVSSSAEGAVSWLAMASSAKAAMASSARASSARARSPRGAVK